MKPAKGHLPNDQRDCLDRGRSYLSNFTKPIPTVYLKDLCFDAGQATEKAKIALLQACGVESPNAHGPGLLRTSVEKAGVTGPEPYGRVRHHPSRDHRSLRIGDREARRSAGN